MGASQRRPGGAQQRWWGQTLWSSLIVPPAVWVILGSVIKADWLGHPHPPAPRQSPSGPLPRPWSCFRCPQPIATSLCRNPSAQTSPAGPEPSVLAGIKHLFGPGIWRRQERRRPPLADRSGLSLRWTPEPRFWKQAAGRPIPETCSEPMAKPGSPMKLEASVLAAESGLAFAGCGHRRRRGVRRENWGQLQQGLVVWLDAPAAPGARKAERRSNPRRLDARPHTIRP